jgi:hypothetical protein
MVIRRRFGSLEAEMNDDDRLSAVRGIVWALPVSIALWAVILMAVGVWRV